MKEPLLQVALDHTSLPGALDAAHLLASELDILEAGTILCYAEGVKTVAALREAHPQHVILADLKVADAGSVAANLVFSRGANLMTLICNAPLATMESALTVAQNHGGDLQVELYGDWTFAHAESWKSIGLTQVVYHRGRDAEYAGQQWSADDLSKITTLCTMGFDVSLTGGLRPEDLSFFKELPLKAVIAGRSLYNAPDPKQAARAFKVAIARIWS